MESAPPRTLAQAVPDHANGFAGVVAPSVSLNGPSERERERRGELGTATFSGGATRCVRLPSAQNAGVECQSRYARGIEQRGRPSGGEAEYPRCKYRY